MTHFVHVDGGGMFSVVLPSLIKGDVDPFRFDMLLQVQLQNFISDFGVFC